MKAQVKILKISNDTFAAASKSTKKKGKKQMAGKRFTVGVPTNKQKRLVDLDVMRSHNFLSSTNPMLTKIYRLRKSTDSKARDNTYITDATPHHVSAIMKLTLNVMQTNPLSPLWSKILWDISQTSDLLPEDCYVTFTRVFERRDNHLVKKKVKNRKRLAILSSGNGENIKRQKKALGHDESLADAVDRGDSVVSFGAEAIVTAPDEFKLEAAVEAVKNYVNANDETRGLTYSLDVGRQSKPFLVYGPDEPAGNKGVFTDMVSFDGGQSSLFVDSGGDRTLGSEYIGVSVGKFIRSHAAYNFQNHTSLIVGNDTVDHTTTLSNTDVSDQSQIYVAKIISRAYLLAGKNVTHFVADRAESVDELMKMPISHDKKEVADVSNGLLNMIEAIDDGEREHETTNRLLARFPMHINNIITLLSQFRSDSGQVSLTDDFANTARDILIDFFVANKYWSYTARRNPEDIRLFGYHDRYKTLADFGQYVQERKSSGRDTDPDIRNAVKELDTIINRNILPTIPALDTHTDSLIDRLVRMRYRVVDLTGMGSGARSGIANPSMNVMMLSYLNILLPSMHNGDVIMIHGISQMSTIAQIIKNMISTCGLNLDVVFTEKNQNNAVTMLKSTSDTTVTTDEVTHESKTVVKQMPIDFVMADLHKNRIDKLYTSFGIDKDWSKNMSKLRGSFFIKTNDGIDYIFLDRIL